MVTSYRIEIGYTGNGPDLDYESELRRVVLGICQNPERILAEVGRVEGPCSIDDDEIMEYIDRYRLPWTDATIGFSERSAGRDFGVIQSATGGGPERDFKESLRRAFIRLVVEAMHGLKIEVNVIVS